MLSCSSAELLQSAAASVEGVPIPLPGLLRPTSPVALAIAALVVLTIGGGCSEDATPVSRQATTTVPVTPHLLEPTEQMQELARQQCLDDPALAEGTVNAVDPGRSDQVVLASVTVDCAEARQTGGSESTDSPEPGAAQAE